VTGRLLTAREVADRLGVSAETVLRWSRRRELPAIKLPGGAIRYRADELDDWLAQRATPVREELSRTPQGAAHWQPSAPGSTLTAVTHPEGEED
jgi:excisionase family DNA binding protein